MIQSFGDRGSQDIFDGKHSKPARKTLPVELFPVAFRKLDWLNRARTLEVLKVPPGNRLEALAGRLKGFWSLRINDQYRIVFQWRDGHAWRVKVTDYH